MCNKSFSQVFEKQFSHTCCTDRKGRHKHAGAGPHSISHDHQQVGQQEEQNDAAVVELKQVQPVIVQGFPQVHYEAQCLRQGREKHLQSIGKGF